MAWALATAGCAPDIVLAPTKPPIADNDPFLQVEPPTWQFGERASAERVSQVFTVSNIGASTLDVDEVLLVGDPSFTLELLDTPPYALVAGDEARIQVTFQPLSSGILDAAIVLLSDSTGDREIRVPVQGIGATPDLVITPMPLDFGAQPITCPTLRVVSLSNQGGEPLQVDRVALEDAPSELELPVAFEPFVLRRSETRSLSIVLQANALGSYTAELVVDSNDPDGQARVPVLAQVVPGAANTDRFVVPEERGVDIVFAVDKSGSMADQVQTLTEEFDHFASTLGAAAADWRVGVYRGEDPACFHGGIIDPSQADWVDRFNAAALDELTSIGLTTNQTAALTEAHLEGVSRLGAMDLAGACGPTLRRADAPLHVIMISDERDQSTGFSGPRADYWVDWLTGIENYAGDPALLTVHAIVDLQSRCGEAPVGPHGYIEAAQATGGRVLDVCGAFAAGLDDIASDVLDGISAFPLSHTDIDSDTITVTLDGVGLTEGWRYDPDDDTIVFSIPLVGGSVIEVTYFYFGDCPA